MADNDYPELDGVAPSWADISVKASGDGVPLIEMKDIAAISSGTTVEVGWQRGTGGRRRKRTTGQDSDEASITFYRSGWQKFLRNLLAKAPKRGNQALVGKVHFDIEIQHSIDGDDEIYQQRIKGCRILGRTIAAAEGTDAEQVEVPLSPAQVVDVVDGVEVALL